MSHRTNTDTTANTAHAAYHAAHPHRGGSHGHNDHHDVDGMGGLSQEDILLEHQFGGTAAPSPAMVADFLLAFLAFATNLLRHLRTTKTRNKESRQERDSTSMSAATTAFSPGINRQPMVIISTEGESPSLIDPRGTAMKDAGENKTGDQHRGAAHNVRRCCVSVQSGLYSVKIRLRKYLNKLTTNDVAVENSTNVCSLVATVLNNNLRHSQVVFSLCYCLYDVKHNYFSPISSNSAPSSPATIHPSATTYSPSTSSPAFNSNAHHQQSPSTIRTRTAFRGGAGGVGFLSPTVQHHAMGGGDGGMYTGMEVVDKLTLRRKRIELLSFTLLMTLVFILMMINVVFGMLTRLSTVCAWLMACGSGLTLIITCYKIRLKTKHRRGGAGGLRTMTFGTIKHAFVGFPRSRCATLSGFCWRLVYYRMRGRRLVGDYKEKDSDFHPSPERDDEPLEHGVGPSVGEDDDAVNRHNSGVSSTISAFTKGARGERDHIPSAMETTNRNRKRNRDLVMILLEKLSAIAACCVYMWMLFYDTKDFNELIAEEHEQEHVAGSTDTLHGRGDGITHRSSLHSSSAGHSRGSHAHHTTQHSYQPSSDFTNNGSNNQQEDLQRQQSQQQGSKVGHSTARRRLLSIAAAADGDESDGGKRKSQHDGGVDNHDGLGLGDEREHVADPKNKKDQRAKKSTHQQQHDDDVAETGAAVKTSARRDKSNNSKGDDSLVTAFVKSLSNFLSALEIVPQFWPWFINISIMIIYDIVSLTTEVRKVLNDLEDDEDSVPSPAPEGIHHPSSNYIRPPPQAAAAAAVTMPSTYISSPAKLDYL